MAAAPGYDAWPDGGILVVQVFKFAIYVAIPVTLTFYVAQNPDLLSSIIKNVRDANAWPLGSTKRLPR